MDEDRQSRRGRLYEGIVREIETRIRNGVLGPGDQLLPERQLAEQLGVSRGAVREALSALAARGLVTIRPGGGAYVADPSIAPLIDLVGAALLYDEVRSHDVLETLRVLEAGITALAAANASPDDVARLRQAAKDMEEAVAGGRPFSEENARFHNILAQATHNSVLLDLAGLINGLVHAVHGEVRDALLTGSEPDVSPVFCRQHAAVLAAVERGDTAAAGMAMSEHLHYVSEQMQAVARRRRSSDH